MLDCTPIETPFSTSNLKLKHLPANRVTYRATAMDEDLPVASVGTKGTFPGFTAGPVILDVDPGVRTERLSLLLAALREAEARPMVPLLVDGVAPVDCEMKPAEGTLGLVEMKLEDVGEPTYWHALTLSEPVAFRVTDGFPYRDRLSSIETGQSRTCTVMWSREKEGEPTLTVDGQCRDLEEELVKSARIPDDVTSVHALGTMTVYGPVHEDERRVAVQLVPHKQLKLKRRAIPSSPDVEPGQTVKCVANVWIDSKGRPEEFRVERCGEPFSKRVSKSLEEWRWYPHREGNARIPVRTRVVFQFHGH